MVIAYRLMNSSRGMCSSVDAISQTSGFQNPPVLKTTVMDVVTKSSVSFESLTSLSDSPPPSGV